MPEEPEEIFEYEEEEDSSPSPVGLVLNSGDVTIFKLIYEHRFLRREHLSALTGRPSKRLHRRLFRLISAGYLSAIRLPQQKHIYSLGKAAVPVLVEQGIAPDDLLAQRTRVHELKELFLRHEMMIVDIHVILTLASRSSELCLVAWQEGRGLHDTVNVSERAGLRRLPVRPDAFFTIADSRRPEGANRAHFFLEADRSTATQTRFTNKIRAYWHYLEQGLHTEKFSIKTFRVLTITLTDERAQNLSHLAASLLPERARKYFLFTSLKAFSLENPAPIFGDVYLSARNTEPGWRRFPLIPPPASAQTAAEA